MNVLLLDCEEPAEGQTVEIVGDQARHLVRVLKVKPGSRIRVGRINGPLGEAEVVRVSESGVVCRCAWEVSLPEPARVDLLLALPRPKVLKRLWSQLAALGVGRIMLTNAEKVERCYFDSHVLEPGFYRKHLVEGLQQARDTRLPEVSIHRRLKVFLEDDLPALCPASLRLMLHPGPARGPAPFKAGESRRLLLAIGPEGGWTAYETDLLGRHGFRSVSLGPRVLRTDTACIAALSLAALVNGD